MYSHLINSFRRIFATRLSLKLNCRYRRMDSATGRARRRQGDNQKYPHLFVSFRHGNPDLGFHTRCSPAPTR
jgi:hypothetical protein